MTGVTFPVIINGTGAVFSKEALSQTGFIRTSGHVLQVKTSPAGLATDAPLPISLGKGVAHSQSKWLVRAPSVLGPGERHSPFATPHSRSSQMCLRICTYVNTCMRVYIYTSDCDKVAFLIYLKIYFLT